MTEDNANEIAEKSSKKKFSPLIIVLIVIIIALIGGGAFFAVNYFNSSKDSDTDENGIKTEPNVFLNDEDAEEYLKDKVSAINVTINRIVYCEEKDGKLMGKVGLENKNDFQYMVQFSVPDTGEVVYTTGLIPPGGKLDEIPVETDWKAGEYTVNAIFTAISAEDNKTNIGQTGIEVPFVVR
jgi:cell division protein YceG involved in septum cleavage